MTARRLTHLTARLLLALPLAACAAQPGPGQASGRTDAPAQAQVPDTRGATVAPAAPAVPVPAATPAASVAQDTPANPTARQDGRTPAPRRAESARAGQATGNAPHPGTVSPEPRALAPSAAAAGGTGTAAGGTSTTDTSTTGTSTTGTAAADANATGTAAGTAAPDVVAPRAATPGVATPGVPAPGATLPPVAMPSGSATGGLLQTLFALILVLAVLGALAWFLKRYGPRAGGGNLRVIGSLNLGGRERIMVVEVGNQWIVVGASPGRINALATLPRQEAQNDDTDAADAALVPHAPAAHSFADWLKQTIDKRK